MRRFALPLVAALALAGCAGADGQVSALNVDPNRCATLNRALDAAYLRLEAPLYLNEGEAAIAKRAVADLELAMTIAGCLEPALSGPKPE